MRSSVRSIAAFAAAALLCLAPGVAHADDTAAPDGCQAVSFPVPQGTLAGTLCLPQQATDVVMVLMSGSNYNATYWDFAYQPETYSFRRAMNRAGFATLTMDRLGNGDSSHPPAMTLTATATADALHEIVQSLRRGFAGTQPFGKVVTVGHSLTSGTSVIEATAHNDVDGVLLTGYSHTLNIPEVLGVIATYYQAVNDPVFAGRALDSGYLTTRPGTRAKDFFGPDADPRVVELDEKTKEVFSLTEYPDGLTSTLPGMSGLIKAPVMIANGSLDRLSCGPAYSICRDAATLLAAETPFFAPAAKLHTFILPGSGHSVNLAPNTAAYQRAVVDWVNTTVK